MLLLESNLTVYMRQAIIREQRHQKFKDRLMKDQRNVIEYHTLANMLQAQDGMITQLEQWSLN